VGSEIELSYSIIIFVQFKQEHIGVFMYKKIRNTLILIIISALVAVSLLIVFVNMRAWEQFVDSYSESIYEKVAFFMETNYADLEAVLTSNAVWTEAIEALNDNDSDWLYDNATGYITDTSAFNIDYIYISTEDEGFSEGYGVDAVSDVRYLETYKKALYKNEASSEIYWIDENPMLISAMPFQDNENENSTGCYMVGRILEEEEIGKLTKILTDHDIEQLSLSKVAQYPDVESLNKREIRMSIPLNVGSTENYFNIVFYIEFLDFIFNDQMYFVLGGVIAAAFVVVILIDLTVKKLSFKLIEIIKFIQEISSGKYHARIKLKKASVLPEVNSLIESVNKMAGDIENHIEAAEHHAQLLDEKYFEMIRLLVSVVEMNDSYTYHHSFSVSEYALMIGRAVGFDDLVNLDLASKLHDVGKISIPTGILNKPGKLTEEEYEIIKTHSEEGYKLLSEIDTFMEARVGVRYHHERYDGRGYPKGLSGDEIPMIAQIISVADVYEALTSDRSYRKAMSSEEAIGILVEEKGRMLNPELVDVFIHEMGKREQQINYEQIV